MIRPNDWTATAEQSRKETEHYEGWRFNLGTACKSPLLKTEELAELHAIIQAIAYDRGQKWRSLGIPFSGMTTLDRPLISHRASTVPTFFSCATSTPVANESRMSKGIALLEH